jgi:uncharacterized protein (TIGR03083 family)
MDAREHRIQLGQAAAEQLTQYLHTLSADAWHHPSACAGWEVCDVVGHLALGAEFYASTVARGVQGDTAPPAGAPLPGVRNAQRAIAYRERLGDQLLATFTGRTAQFYQLLQRLGPQDWEKPCYHPFGLRPAQRFITMRLIELAMHAWDIQSALDPTAVLFPDSLPVFMEGVPGIVSRLRVQPDARRLVPLRCHFTVTGAVPSQYDMLMTTDQVQMEPGGATAADVTCRCDTETFVLLMYGRLAPQAAVVNGRLVVEGDRRLLTVGKWFTGV